MTGQKNVDFPAFNEWIYRIGSSAEFSLKARMIYSHIELRSLGIYERDAVPMAGRLNLASETTWKKRTDTRLRSDTCKLSIFT